MNMRELAARARAVRHRRNRDIVLAGWAVGNMMAPHVKDMPSLRDIILTAPGYDPDESDLV